MSRYITKNGTISVQALWKKCSIAKDQVRDMMVASSQYQLAVKDEGMRDQVHPRDIMVASAQYQLAVKDENMYNEVQPRRKKRRLTDLSFEDKLRRKKLKNREAAQNSRDKKKAYVSNLEATVNSLLEENDQLKEEMNKLCEQNKYLIAENARLEGLLEGGVVRTTEERPAAPACPLQKDSCPAAPPVISCHLLILLCLMMSLIGWSTPLKHQTSRSCRSLQTLYQKHLSFSRMSNPLRKRQEPWWGPHQRSWNPMPSAAHLMLKKVLSLSLIQQMS